MSILYYKKVKLNDDIWNMYTFTGTKYDVHII